ncbi:MAG: hypothetical protein WCQ20_14900 [Synechococcaceae cyanobacterium ELA739]|jgi:hypothetical protein
MKTFWQQALAQAAAGLIIAAAAGVGYLCWSIPRQLDLVLQNQKTFGDRFDQLGARVSRAEDQIQGLDTRVTKIEAR